MTVIIDCGEARNRERAIAAALSAVRRGDVVVVPTESVYAVAADAFSVRGVASIREVKDYDVDASLPVMVGSRSMVAGVAGRLTDGARQLMQAFWPGPLTLLVEAQPSLAWDLPGDAPLAVRMPVHPVLLALLAQSGPLVVTGAGVVGRDEPLTADAALAQAGCQATVVLDAGPCDTGVRSTVIDARTTPAVIVREGSLSRDEIEAACPGVVAGPQ